MNSLASDCARTVDHPLGRENVRTSGIDVAGGYRFHDARRAAAFGVDQELRLRMQRTLQPDVLADRCPRARGIRPSTRGCSRGPSRGARARRGTCRGGRGSRGRPEWRSPRPRRCPTCSSSRSPPSLRPSCSRTRPRRRPGCSAFQSRSCAASMVAASEQPAARSGSSTVFSGERMAAVSAMKCTPQKTITSAAGPGGLAREPERVAHDVGDVLHFGTLVVVGEDHRVALAGGAADFLVQLRECVPLRVGGCVEPCRMIASAARRACMPDATAGARARYGFRKRGCSGTPRSWSVPAAVGRTVTTVISTGLVGGTHVHRVDHVRRRNGRRRGHRNRDVGVRLESRTRPARAVRLRAGAGEPPHLDAVPFHEPRGRSASSSTADAGRARDRRRDCRPSRWRRRHSRLATNSAQRERDKTESDHAIAASLLFYVRRTKASWRSCRRCRPAVQCSLTTRCASRATSAFPSGNRAGSVHRATPSSSAPPRR